MNHLSKESTVSLVGSQPLAWLTFLSVPTFTRLQRSGLLLILTMLGLVFADPAGATLTVTPSSWDIVGLDSNSPATGPKHFPIGVRVCSDVATTNVAVNFFWDSANTYINTSPGIPTTVTIDSIAAGQCASAYFEAEITQVAAAFDTFRRYHITATDTTGTVSTPVPRQLYVEYLISQNRNVVSSVQVGSSPATLATVPPGGAMNLVLGNTYTIRVNSSTATQGYNQLENFFDMPGNIFQVLTVDSIYSANSTPNTTPRLVPVPNPSVYANACGWDANPSSPNYSSCVAGDYKAGGTVTTTYTVKIIGGAGTSTQLNTLIYDFSGSSFHYNSDFSTNTYTANIQGPVFTKAFTGAVTGGTSRLTFTITNPTATALSGVNFTDTLPTSPGAMVVAPGPVYSTTNCGSPNFAPTAGAASLSFSNGTIAAGGTCTISVDVTVPVATTPTNLYNNTSGNLFIGANNTGLKATASLAVSDTATGNGACTTSIPLSTLTGGGSVSVSFATPTYTANPWPTTATRDPTQYVAFTSSTPGSAVLQTLAFQGLVGQRGPTRGALYYSTDSNFTTGVTQVTTLTGGATGSTSSEWVFDGTSRPYGATGLPNGVYYRLYGWAAPVGSGAQTLQITNLAMTGCVNPSLAKAFSPNPVAKGGESTLTFTLTNTNTSALSGVKFSDTLPAGLVVATTPSPTTSLDCGSPSWAPEAGKSLLEFGQTTGATIPAGASCTVSVKIEATTAGSHVNVSGLISSTQSGTNTTNTGFGTATLTAIEPPIIGKAFSEGFINPGDTTTLSFTITNPNPANALSGIAFTDTYCRPSECPNLSGLKNSTPLNTNGNCNGGTVTASAGGSSISLSGGTLAAGASCQITVVVTAPAGTYPNEVQVSALINGTSVNGNTSTDTLSVREPIGGISLLKQVATSNIGPWSTFTNVDTSATPDPDDVWYRFTIENIGEIELSPVSVSDPTVSASSCSWPATLPVAGPSTDPTATCVVGPKTAQNGLNPNTATALGSAGGTTYYATASAEYLGAAPGFNLIKEISTSASGPWSQFISIDPSTPVYYRFTLSNTGGVALTNPKVTDTSSPAIPAIQPLIDSTCAFTNPLPIGGATFCIVGPVTAVNTFDTTVVNTAKGSASNVANPTAPSTATYQTKAENAITIGGNIFRDNGKGCTPPSSCASNGVWNTTAPANEPIFNVNGTAPLFIVITDSFDNVLAVAETCMYLDVIFCQFPGTWTADVPPGTGYKAWVTPIYPSGSTVTPPSTSTPPAGWIMTKGGVVGGAAPTGSVLSFDASAGQVLNFGVLKGSCSL